LLGQNPPGPPPTNDGQSPQMSPTTNATMLAAPAAWRWTSSVAWVVPAGKLMLAALAPVAALLR
jgi:hypothetical protein